MPTLLTNVGFRGKSRSNADIAEPSLLTPEAAKHARYRARRLRDPPGRNVDTLASDSEGRVIGNTRRM